MKLHTKIKALRAASNAALTASMMSLAADLSVCYGLVFVTGWDWKDPVHTGLPWMVPICILTALTFGLFWASDRLAFKVQALERRAEFLAAQQHHEEKRRRA